MLDLSIQPPAIRTVSWRAHLLAILGYLLLAALVTYPAVRHFATQVPGDLIADRDQNLWNLWWLRDSITHFTNPFHTDLLYYPFGVSLYYHTLELPLGLIGLAPQFMLGLPAAYNTVLLAAFTLSGYGAFRLGLLLTHEAEAKLTFSPYLRVPAAFLGGVVFAFTPYTLDALKGQLEVLSLQWMPFYAEAWLRAWNTGKVRYGILAGTFMALAAYSSLYYAVYLLVFSAAYLVYRVVSGQWSVVSGRGNREGAKDRKEDESELAPIPTQNSKLKTQNFLPLSPLLLVPAVALILALPLVIGLARNHGDPRLEVAAGAQDKLAHSADLLSFFAPPHDHPLLGGNSTSTPGVDEPAIHDYLSLEYVALALALLGAVVAWRAKGVRFWVVLALVALVLAMGPQLQVGRNLTGVPLPFAALQWLPGADAIAKPERFVVLARLCMGVLATWGAWRGLSWLASRLPKNVAWRQGLACAAVLALLLVELPIHARYEQPLSIPAGFQTLASQKPGGLMELPFAVQLNGVAGERMLYQTTHGDPIMAGYLARNYNSPIVDSCGPFWGFISARYLPIAGRDIVSPTMTSRPLDLLNFYGLKYLAVYNNYNGPGSQPLDPDELAAYKDIAAAVSHTPPLAQDSYMSLYRVDSEPPSAMQSSLMVSDGWYDIEAGDTPFRWLKGDQGRLCVFSPQPVQATLTMEATSFGGDRQVNMSTPALYAGTGVVSPSTLMVPGRGQFGALQVPVTLGAGMTEVDIRPQGQPTTPQSLDPANKDSRPLTVGVRNLRLEVGKGK